MVAKARVNTAKQRQDGRWKGWRARTSPSYPEQYVAELLDRRGWVFERELPLEGFFIDFAFPALRVALEVDGKQHFYPENAARDARKDQALQAAGWTVIRIAWHGLFRADVASHTWNSIHAAMARLASLFADRLPVTTQAS